MTKSSQQAADSVMFSRNEVETLCAKAARGAGMSWGEAEDAGFSAGWLVARGVDGPEAMLTHLEWARGKATDLLRPVVAKGEWHASGDDPLCPIAVGTAISDFAGTGQSILGPEARHIGPIHCPILTVPFLAYVAQGQGKAVRVTWSGGQVRVTAGGQLTGDVADLARSHSEDMHMSLVPDEEAGAVAANACSIRRDTLADLNGFAMKTTVPPSEKSRSDAGAGTTDND